jgi:hypothetical protein
LGCVVTATAPKLCVNRGGFFVKWRFRKERKGDGEF